MRNFLSFLFLSTLFSCRLSVDLYVDYAGFSEPEKQFLVSTLNDKALQNLGIVLTDSKPPQAIVLSFESRRTGWQKSEAENPPEFLPLSRVCMVLPVEVWENKTVKPEDFSAKNNAANSALIPLAELAPPHVAQKIDGYDVSSPYYPLIDERGIRFSYEDKHSQRFGKKILLLTQYIQEKLNEKRNEEKNSNGGNSRTFYFEERPVLFTIAAGGDLMLARGAEDILFAEGAEGILGGTASLAAGADLTLVNLEGAITGRGTEAGKTYTFRFNPRSAPALKEAGFDAVLLANNHAFDFGAEGFFDSLVYLEEAGLGVLGAGRNIAAAASPFVFGTVPLYEQGRIVPVKVFGIASYGREMSGWDGLDYAASELRGGILHAGKQGAQLIQQQLHKDAMNIVFYHGGIEYADYPDNATRSLYTGLVRGGADLVIGTHPHVEQGFEWVEGKPVFWSLGDYVFNEMDDTPGGDKGIFIVLHYLGRTLVHIDLYPVFMAGPRTVIAPPEQLERFYRLTKTLAQK